MKTATLILLGLLVVWWVLLAAFLTLNYRKRVREAKQQPLTPEVREECRQLEQSIPPYHMRAIDWVFISPIILVMLPLYLYGWLVKDPYATQDEI
ncbi:MAG TPA: hypothetical protein VN673_17335 [Clostridia bacterium]|nr:hypothetical protein [Clostridia bacterium]